MRALVCEAYGPIENLKIRDMPKPEPRAGEVLVKVGAAGVSFAVMLGVQGKHQNKPALPYVPGNELAGHIVALGRLSVPGMALGLSVVQLSVITILCTLAAWLSGSSGRGIQLPGTVADWLILI